MRVTAVLFFILSITATAFGQNRVLWDEQPGDLRPALCVLPDNRIEWVQATILYLIQAIDERAVPVILRSLVFRDRV